jgi:cytochrome P450
MSEREGVPVTEFDHHSADFAANADEELRALRETCPVAWSERYGGFWVVSDFEGNHEVLKHPEIFTAERWPVDDGHGASLIPKSVRVTEPVLPMEIDPPGHTPVRQLLNPLLSPAATEALRSRVVYWTTRVIDAIIERGECDLLYDVTGPVPARVSMEWLGFPLEHADLAAQGIHNLMGFPPGSEEYALGIELTAEATERLRETIAKRRDEPADDVISHLMAQELNGKPVDDATIMNLGQSLIAGGVDTTTALTSSALVHLHHDRELRQRLIDQPELIVPATEEFLRVYPPLTSIAKTVRRETELRGCPMHPGDRVLVSRQSANFDAKQFESPERFDPERFPNRHVSFGLGPHRCAGSHLARMQFKEMLGQILERLGDYELDEASIAPYPDRGLTQGWTCLPATFTPGARLGDQG